VNGCVRRTSTRRAAERFPGKTRIRSSNHDPPQWHQGEEEHRAGGLTSVNHNRTAIKVRSGLRAAGISSNHNARLFAL